MKSHTIEISPFVRDEDKECVRYLRTIKLAKCYSMTMEVSVYWQEDETCNFTFEFDQSISIPDDEEENILNILELGQFKEAFKEDVHEYANSHYPKMDQKHQIRTFESLKSGFWQYFNFYSAKDGSMKIESDATFRTLFDDAKKINDARDFSVAEKELVSDWFPLLDGSLDLGVYISGSMGGNIFAKYDEDMNLYTVKVKIDNQGMVAALNGKEYSLNEMPALDKAILDCLLIS